MPGRRWLNPRDSPGNLSTHSLRLLYESELEERITLAEGGDADAARGLLSDLADFVELRARLPEALRSYMLPKLRQITGERQDRAETLGKEDRAGFRSLVERYREFEGGGDANEAFHLATPSHRPRNPRQAERAATEDIGHQVAEEIVRLRAQDADQPKRLAKASIARRWAISNSLAEKAWRAVRKSLLAERLRLTLVLFIGGVFELPLPRYRGFPRELPPPIALLPPPPLIPSLASVYDRSDSEAASRRLRFIELAEGKPFAPELGLEIAEELTRTPTATPVETVRRLALRREVSPSFAECAQAEARSILRALSERDDLDEKRQRWIAAALRI